MSHFVGDIVELDHTFRIADEPADPTGVTLRVTRPDGGVSSHDFGTDPDLRQADRGRYTREIRADQEGTWRYRWEGTGAAQGVEEGSFLVERSRAGAWLLGAVLGALALAAGLIVFFASLASESESPKVTAAAGAPATSTAPPAPTTSTTTSSLPPALAKDPLLRRLNKEGKLPFTAGPWRKAAWRDTIYAKLSAPVQARATRITQGGGFVIVIK